MKPLSSTDPVSAGPYHLLAELGRGGMGRVLLGTSPDGRLVAVKQVHARFAADDGFRARFRREVAASRKVSGAYTAAVMDADAEARTPWLASVFVAGPSLGATVEAAGTLPEESVRRLAAGLATALVEIHRAGIVHRDLKPENVLLAQDGVRVIDFGIARVAEGTEITELTQTGWVVGSPSFMSPEQAEGHELTPASDVFSLGAVLAMAATGSSPFAGTSMAQTLYNVVHATPDLTAVPPGLRGLVEPCLAKDPAARPAPEQFLALLGPVAPAERQWPPAVHQLIAAQRADIDRLLGDTERTIVQGPARADERTALYTRVVGPAAPPPRPRTGKVITLVTAGVVAVAGIGVGAYLLKGGGSEEQPEVPDKYVKAPLCSESAARLPLPARAKALDVYNEGYDSAETSCYWARTYKVEGKPYEMPGTREAYVDWKLYRSLRGNNGTEVAREEFGQKADKAERAEKLGIGDEAYWRDPGPDDEDSDHCNLYVRDGNLVVGVTLGTDKHPPSSCRADAGKIARTALAATPR